MGRAPCCDKASVKKGPWSPEEDAVLKAFIEENGTGGNWIALPQKIGLKRCGKSCRLRWLNYLRPNIRHGGFTEEEDNIICSLYMSIGSRWSVIAAQLPGRTDNDIKNYWNTRLKKKLLGKQRKELLEAQRVKAQYEHNIKRDQINYNVNCAFPVVGVTNQVSYWPNQPLLSIPQQENQNQEPNFYPKEGQDLIGNLIKIEEGGFLREASTFRVPFQQPPFDGTVSHNVLASSASSRSNSVGSRTSSPVPTNRCNVPGSADEQEMLQALGDLPIELVDDMVHGETQQAEGVESYGVLEMVNNLSVSGGTSFSGDQSNSWDDITSLVYDIPSQSDQNHQNEASLIHDYMVQSYLAL